MPIAINGNGTITGVSVGGLPDGIVDTDMLAAGAVTVPKVGYNGSVLQVVGTQSALSSNIATTSTTYVDSSLSVTITPVAADSNILVRFSGYHPHPHPNNGNKGVAIKIYRSVNSGTDTACTAGHTSGAYYTGGGSNEWFDVTGQTQILDDPTYTLGNSIVYKLYFREADNNTQGGYLHHVGGLQAQTDQAYLQASAMEISA